MYRAIAIINYQGNRKNYQEVFSFDEDDNRTNEENTIINHAETKKIELNADNYSVVETFHISKLFEEEVFSKVVDR